MHLGRRTDNVYLDIALPLRLEPSKEPRVLIKSVSDEQK